MFHGARVLLNPPASIVTSRWTLSSSGNPKNPAAKFSAELSIRLESVVATLGDSLLRFGPEDRETVGHFVEQEAVFESRGDTEVV